MLASSRGNPLLVWCLATFQTAGFVLVLVTLLYLSGDLGETLDGLNTAVGLGLYGVLWATNWWATRKAVAGLDLVDPAQPVSGGALLGRGFVWGGVNGVLFVLVLLAPLLVVVVSDGDVNAVGALALLAYFLFLGSIAAFVAGSLIGLAFALINWAMLAFAHTLGRVGDDNRTSTVSGIANGGSDIEH